MQINVGNFAIWAHFTTLVNFRDERKYVQRRIITRESFLVTGAPSIDRGLKNATICIASGSNPIEWEVLGRHAMKVEDSDMVLSALSFANIL